MWGEIKMKTVIATLKTGILLGSVHPLVKWRLVGVYIYE